MSSQSPSLASPARGSPARLDPRIADRVLSLLPLLSGPLSLTADDTTPMIPPRRPAPMPAGVLEVPELGVTSAPLKSASFFIGEHCKAFNGKPALGRLFRRVPVLTGSTFRPRVRTRRGLYAVQGREPGSGSLPQGRAESDPLRAGPVRLPLPTPSHGMSELIRVPVAPFAGSPRSGRRACKSLTGTGSASSETTRSASLLQAPRVLHRD